MPEHGDACLEPGEALDLVGDDPPDPSEPRVAVAVVLLDDGLLLLARAAREPVPLGDDDDGEVAACVVPPPDVVAGVFDRRRLLGQEDDVGAARDPARRRDPAGIPAHDLDDHDPVVGLGGRVQSVDRLRADLDGGIEADRHVRAREVVVDRLRDADDRVVVFVSQAMRDSERALASDRDDARDLESSARLEEPLDARLLAERVEPRGAEDRPASGQDPGDRSPRERQQIGLDEAPPPVADADRVVIVRHEAASSSPDRCVQTGAVPAAREDSVDAQ